MFPLLVLPRVTSWRPFRYSRSNDLVVTVLDYQSKGPWFKTTRGVHGKLNVSSSRGRSSDYRKLRRTWWLKVRWPLLVILKRWGWWTLSMKGGHKVFCFLVFLFRKCLKKYQTRKAKRLNFWSDKIFVGVYV